MSGPTDDWPGFVARIKADRDRAFEIASAGPLCETQVWDDYTAVSFEDGVAMPGEHVVGYCSHLFFVSVPTIPLEHQPLSRLSERGHARTHRVFGQGRTP